MTSELSRAIEQLTKEKGIGREVLVEALEKSMLAAARKKYGPNTDIEAQYNDELGEVELFEFRTVVDEIMDHSTEISVGDAMDLDPDVLPGDSLGMKMNLGDFGRIAAQTAKQVLLQHMRDAEREHIYNEYKDRKDELITGTVRRFERGALIVDLGRTEGVLPSREQLPTESYRPGDRIQAYVLDVLRTSRGPQIILSRTHPGLIKKLFEMEVPEIFEGIVRIEAAVREAGFRAKIAVTSSDVDVDPVGACVGLKGSRVQAVVQELRGEKIDIIPWSYDPARFVCNAIAPAIVVKVIVDEETKSMELIVPDDQLSLAIGRRGQNVRLAAQLTGWKLDIVSETKLRELNGKARADLATVPQLGETMVEIAVRHGYRSVLDLADSEFEELVDVLGVDDEKAQAIIESCEEVLELRALLEMKERGSDTESLETRLKSRGVDLEDLERVRPKPYVLEEPEPVAAENLFSDSRGLGAGFGAALAEASAPEVRSDQAMEGLKAANDLFGGGFSDLPSEPVAEAATEMEAEEADDGAETIAVEMEADDGAETIAVEMEADDGAETIAVEQDSDVLDTDENSESVDTDENSEALAEEDLG